MESIDTGNVGRVLSEQFITIRSASGHRTFRIGPGLLVSAIAAGIGLLAWTALSTGLAMWHLAGVDDPGTTSGGSRTSQADLLGNEIARLEKMEDLLEDQHSAALLALRDSAGRRARSEALLAEIGPSDDAGQEADGAGGGDDHILLALDRTVDELAAARQQNRELDNQVKLLTQESRRVESVVLRLSAAINSATESIENELARLDQSPEALVGEIRSIHAGRGGWLDEANLRSHGANSAAADRLATIIESLAGDIDRLDMTRLAYLSAPFAHPVPGRRVRLSSGFGNRMHPVYNRRQFHEGVDYAAATGTPVRATGDGIVTFAGWESGFGRAVKIRHVGDTETRYGHLNKIHVRKWQRVSRGDHIGDIGSTGNSTGPHLHYEVRVGGKPVNPLKFIRMH